MAVHTLDGRPMLQGLIIIVGTFILEDAVTVLAAMRTAAGGMPFAVALVALYIGIALGDIWLYGLGRLSARLEWLRRLLPHSGTEAAKKWLSERLAAAVLTSRFVPGMRLPTYTACGYLGVPFGRFTLYVIGATLAWTTLLFTVSISLGSLMMRYLGVWRWAGALGFAVAVVLIGRGISRASTAQR